MWLLCASSAVGAFMREVEPGESPKLDADEGLLVVAVDSNIALSRVRVNRSSNVLSWATVRGVANGRALRLYAVPQGEYHWQSATLDKIDAIFEVGDDQEFHFTVKPGQINYPGDLLFRSVFIASARIHIANRALTVIDWLEREHPGLYAKYELGFTGHFNDPFPQFYRQARARPDAKAISTDEVAIPAPRAGSPELLGYLRRPRLAAARINPRGDLVAVVGVDQADNGKRTWVVDLYDMESASATRLAQVEFGIGTLEWSGNDMLVIGVGEADEPQALSIVRAIDGAPKRRFELLRVPRAGMLVDSLPSQPDHILFASRDSRRRLQVHRLEVRDQKSLDRYAFRSSDRIDPPIDGAQRWFTDGAGRLRLVTVIKGGKAELLHGQGDAFRAVYEFNDNSDFLPLALSADGNTILGLSDKERAQRELVSFDPGRKAIAATLVAKPGFDLESVLFDSARRVIGAGYRRNGVQAHEYLDASERARDGALARAFPDASIDVLDRSADNRKAIVLVESSARPPRLYYVDVQALTAELLDDAMPWLSEQKLVPSQVVRATSADGLALEGYLTLPPGAGKRPLVIMPHGGPIDFADTRSFDGVVQLLAAQGFAVLQVNFRGSAGYGKAFRDAGKRAQGTGIEDDIERVLNQALADYPLDAGRMCVIGASYGGYSSLVSLVRWPNRFRCAVSISGVTDRILRYTASDGGRSKKGREELIEYMGDPRTQEAELVASSPLYRYREIVAPVMLVHGTEDWRVDYEHSLRLDRMLRLAGRAPVFLTQHGEGHVMLGLDVRLRQWRAIVGFLQQHLSAIDNR
jgi:dipeptidyl aminopeptidase/acylaminoacyl peptidase